MKGNNMMFFQGSKVIDKSKFTNEGLKEKNNAVVARLYDGGLAFVSSVDGRRFATELELSKHLDALFRKNQIEKSMVLTDERGWYKSDPSWSGMGQSSGGGGGGDQDGLHDSMEFEYSQGDSQRSLDTTDPALLTVTADESRDRCVICGINFSMKFNDDEGESLQKHASSSSSLVGSEEHIS